MSDLPRQLLARWLQAVCGGYPYRVVDLYMPDAVLLPTVEELAVGKEEIRAYFEKFLSKDDLCGEVNSLIVQCTPASIITSGIYTFAWEENDMPKTVRARYSFVFVSTDQGWLILNHHSSKVP